MSRSLKKVLLVCVFFGGLAYGLNLLMKPYMSEHEKPAVGKNSIVHLDLDNAIWNGKRFIQRLKEYREESEVKAFLIDINSPGGAVGPSQEIFSEIKKTREEFKKPVICTSRGVIASGAYYAAAACDKIIVAPGALVGSIGVIMEFANLEKLYDWAKISRYSITSGKYKDSGAEYRNMREDEKLLFQDMINEVYQQFRVAVMQARQLKDNVMDEYADGRVFTGAKAVELGFADSIGTYEDAVNLAATEAGLGKDFDVYEIPKRKRSILDFGSDNEDDNVNAVRRNQDLRSLLVREIVSAFLGMKWEGPVAQHEQWNQPLYLLPSAVGR